MRPLLSCLLLAMGSSLTLHGQSPDNNQALRSKLPSHVRLIKPDLTGQPTVVVPVAPRTRQETLLPADSQPGVCSAVRITEVDPSIDPGFVKKHFAPPPAMPAYRGLPPCEVRI